jgi:D-3-phosphoglycerate dehydrogenase
VKLQELFARADILSLHAPLSRETMHLLGEKELHALKRGAFLVNTSRGQLVDEKALYQVLQEGWLGGAALDVLEQEPIPADHPFLSLENLILTPHAAFYSEGSLQELKRQTARAVARMLKSEPKADGDGYCLINKEAMGS